MRIRLAIYQALVNFVIKFTSCLPMVGGSPASSTTKTGRHDIAEMLRKVALKHQKSKSNQI